MHFRYKTQRDNNSASRAKVEIQAALADGRESLYWTALMITGEAELAQQSIIDAAGLTQTNGDALCAWLVCWGHRASARAAVNTVRSFIHQTAAQYPDWTCSHLKHEPLSPADIRILRELDVYEAIEQLDVLARSALVLYGCQHVSLSDCVLLLNVPLQSVIVAYCRALQWYRKRAEVAGETSAPHSRLTFIRHDPDGVPVWAMSA